MRFVILRVSNRLSVDQASSNKENDWDEGRNGSLVLVAVFAAVALFWLEEDSDDLFKPKNAGFVALTDSHLILGFGAPKEVDEDSLW